MLWYSHCLRFGFKFRFVTLVYIGVNALICLNMWVELQKETSIEHSTACIFTTNYYWSLLKRLKPYKIKVRVVLTLRWKKFNPKTTFASKSWILNFTERLKSFLRWRMKKNIKQLHLRQLTRKKNLFLDLKSFGASHIIFSTETQIHFWRKITTLTTLKIKICEFIFLIIYRKITFSTLGFKVMDDFRRTF